MKRALYLTGGILALLLGTCFAGALPFYVLQGAGLQSFGPIMNPFTVLFGLVQVVAISGVSGVCFVLGVGWCAHGLVRVTKEAPEDGPLPKA